MSQYTTTIRRLSETREYRVRLYKDGVYVAGSDYYTDDPTDAAATARYMREQAEQADRAALAAL
jgi:hypothetical protein